MIAAIWLPLILIALGVGFVGGHESGYAKGRADERKKITAWQRSRGQ